MYRQQNSLLMSRSKCLQKPDLSAHYGENQLSQTTLNQNRNSNQTQLSNSTLYTNTNIYATGNDWTTDLDILAQLLEATNNNPSSIISYTAYPNHQSTMFSDMNNVLQDYLPISGEVETTIVTTPLDIGEELTTPVINISAPDFNLSTNTSNSNKLHNKKQSELVMLNEKSFSSYAQKCSPINCPQSSEFWSDDSQQTILFSEYVQNSPLGSDLPEKSFSYTQSLKGLLSPVKVKNSQEYFPYSLEEEIDQIYEASNNPSLKSDMNFASENNIEGDITREYYENKYSDEDTNLEMAVNMQDVFLNKTYDNSNNNNKFKETNKFIEELDDEKSENIEDYCDYLTPAPSPQSPLTNLKYQSICTEEVQLEKSEDVNDRQPILPQHMEHNYTYIQNHNYNIDDQNLILKKSVLENSIANLQNTTDCRKNNRNKKRVSPLKIKLVTPTMRCLKEEYINTPDITDDILEMEDEIEFNLIQYVTQDQQSMEKFPNNNVNTQEHIKRERSCTPTTYHQLEVPQQLTPPQSIKKRRISYESPSSVQSMTSTILSDDSYLPETSSAPPAKRRGRPPKTEPTVLSPSQSKHFSEADWKYMEMRNKNNEASRRSRINKKDRECSNEIEARRLEAENKILYAKDQKIKRQCEKWRKKLLTAAQS